MPATITILAKALIRMVIEGRVHGTFGQIKTSTIGCRIGSGCLMVMMLILGLFSALVSAL